MLAYTSIPLKYSFCPKFMKRVNIHAIETTEWCIFVEYGKFLTNNNAYVSGRPYNMATVYMSL